MTAARIHGKRRARADVRRTVRRRRNLYLFRRTVRPSVRRADHRASARRAEVDSQKYDEIADILRLDFSESVSQSVTQIEYLDSEEGIIFAFVYNEQEDS